MSFMRCISVALCCLLGCNSSQTAVKKNYDIPKPTATLDGNVAIAFSPDSKWLAIGAELVDTSTWKVAAMLEERVSDKKPTSKNHWGYTSVAFSPDSKQLALGDQDGSLRILDVPSMNLKQEVLAHGARITGIGFANDNETIVTTSVDDIVRIRVWNSRTDEQIFRSVGSDKAPVEEKGVTVDAVAAVDVFALSPNRELFAVADVMSQITIGSIKDGKIMHQFKGPNGDQVEMDSLAFSADSSQILVGVTPNVFVYDLNGEPTDEKILTTANSEALKVLSMNEADLAAMYYVDAESKLPSVAFYDVTQSKSLGSFFSGETRGTYWSVSPNGKHLATTSRGGPVQIWNLSDVLPGLSK